MNLKKLSEFIKQKGHVSAFDVMKEFNIGYQHAWRSLKNLLNHSKPKEFKISYVQEDRNGKPVLVHYYSFSEV